VLVAACVGVAVCGEQLTGLTGSPDGTRLAFVRTGEQGSTLEILEVASGKLVAEHRLPGWQAEVRDGMSWSPDGTWIAVILIERRGSLPEGFFLYRIDVRSGRAMKLAGRRPDIFQRPLISPRADSVLFRDARRRDVNLLRLGMKKPDPVTRTGDVYRLAFGWFPDGSQVYFGRGDRSETGAGIWTWTRDATESRLLEGSVELKPVSLRVSRSGSWLAVVEQGDAENAFFDRLLVSRVKQFEPQKLSDNVSRHLDWSPGGDRLVFVASGRLAFWAPGDSGSTYTDIPATLPVWVNGATVAYFQPDPALLGETGREIWCYRPADRTRRLLFSLTRAVPVNSPR